MKSVVARARTVPAPRSPERKFDLGEILGYRLARLSASVGNLAAREAREIAGLTLPEFRVLVVLFSRGSSGVVGLQQAMLIDKAWISRTLASLAAKGLVAAAADHADARRTAYSVTAKGKRVAAALIEKALERQNRLLRGFAPSEVEMLVGFLSRVQENTDRENG